MAPCARRGRLGSALAGLAGVALAGCAGSTAFEPRPGSALTPAGEVPTPEAACAAVGIGSSHRAEVASALGRAIVVAFDSGYEVWVYRWPGADGTPRSATELVVLFDPAGTASKVRLRPGAPADPSRDSASPPWAGPDPPCGRRASEGTGR